MKLSLRRKIIATNVVVLFLTFFMVVVIVIEGFGAANERMLVQNLIHQADIAVIYIKQTLLSGNNSQTMESEFITRSMDFASKISRDTPGTRVLVFSKSKDLIADSDGFEPIRHGFKELDEILLGNRTHVTRNIGSYRHMYFGFPVMVSGNLVGEIILVYPMNSIDNNLKNIRLLFLLSFIVGVFTILIVSILMTLRITHPVIQLKKAASEISKGNYGTRIMIESSDEIADLALAFNKMSGEIENRVNLINIERSKLNSVLESMGEGVIALDSANNIIALNNSAKSLFPPPPNLGKAHVHDGFGTSESLEIMREIEKIAQTVKDKNSREMREIQILDKNVLVCATPLNLDSADNGVVLIFNDISELRHLQEKQRQFVTNVSHELKTPLTTILGYIELLKERGSDSEVFKTSVHYLEGAGERLLRLVNDLVDLSSLSKFEFEIEPRSTNMSILVKDIAGQMALKAQKFGIKINTCIVENIILLVDPARMKQAVVNILDNSIKYSPGGEINVTLIQNSDGAVLEIADTGYGIPAEFLDKIFEPFYRVDKARSRNIGGNGLGLSITKEIVEKHLGKIALSSQEGKGTTVTILLPAVHLLDKA